MSFKVVSRRIVADLHTDLHVGIIGLKHSGYGKRPS